MKWLHYGFVGKAWIWLKWKAVPSYMENTSRLIRLLELQGRKGMGFAVMADIRVKRKQSTMVQVKEKSKETWGFFVCEVAAWEEGVTVFAVGATSYWHCISWSQEFCSRTLCLYLTDKIDPCHSQLQGFQPFHNQSAINGVSGCGRILNGNCCKVLITSIDFLDNCNQLKQRYIVCKPLLLEIPVINEHAKGELRVHFIS